MAFEGMYQFYIDDILIGYSKLKGIDPGMGTATDDFFPSSDFEKIRARGKPDVDGFGKVNSSIICWDMATLRSPEGAPISTIGTFLRDFIEIKDDLRYLVDCVGIPDRELQFYFKEQYSVYMKLVGEV